LRILREEVLTLGIELHLQDVEFQEGRMARGVGRTFLFLRGRSSRFFSRNYGMAQMAMLHDRLSEEKKKLHRENTKNFLAKFRGAERLVIMVVRKLSVRFCFW
jgi:hypothetical protein